MWKWDEISMDFVTLPTTQKRHDAIWVVVDRLTKSAHFLPIRKNYGISKLAEIFRQEIVRLHGTPTSIVSDRDPKFTSRFLKGLQKAWGTRLKFSTVFHPQTDGQSERTIQTLEDMLKACALEWTGPELIEITNEKVAVAKEKLKEARSRQKSYADKHRRDLEFQVGDRVFLKVSPFRGVKRFRIKGKLSPRFIGPFKILERIGEVSYRLTLPPQLSHVHDVFSCILLRGYHIIHACPSYPFDQIQPDMSLSEEPESILDRQERSTSFTLELATPWYTGTFARSWVDAFRDIGRAACGLTLEILEVQLQALVDRKNIIITELIVRRDLPLEDAEGVDCLPNATSFEQLTLMGVWDEIKDISSLNTSLKSWMNNHSRNQELTSTSPNSEMDQDFPRNPPYVFD
ncbi:DNA/RNA polymerases superfamily protein [Tanacetum coccineum]